MKNNITISIGIPAYNERNNIIHIVSDIMKQKGNRWVLQEILVYCDGCTDGTEEILKEIGNKKIQVMHSTKRRGVTHARKRIMDVFRGDILVFFDADVKLAHDQVVDRMVERFLNNHEVMLVSAHCVAEVSEGFASRSIRSAFEVFEKYRQVINNGNNMFNATGTGIALRRKFAKEITFPKILMNEDDFLYLLCKHKGYIFRYVKNAVVYYQLPTSFPDYIKLTIRSNHEVVNSMFRKSFGTLLDAERYIPRPLYFKSIMEVFISKPLETAVIILINILIRPFITIIAKHFNIDLFTIASSK